MKTGLTIQQMAQELLRQSKAKQDYLVNTGSLSLSVTTDAPQLRVTENGLDKIAPLDIRQTAHRQLGTYLGIPQKYYELMRTDAPELLAYNANYWFSQKNELRTLRTMDGCARAFLSNRYRRIDNLDIASVTLPVIGELPEARFVSTQITDDFMYIKVVNPRLQADVVPGDVVQAGVIISNSETGLGSVTIQPLIYRLVCSNGMVINDAKTRRNHVGRAATSDEDFSIYSNETLLADDHAFVLKIKDTVRAAISEARFAQAVSRMRESTEAMLDTKQLPAIVKLASSSFGITEDESNGVLEHLITGGDFSLYGLANAVTRFSQDVESYGVALRKTVIHGGAACAHSLDEHTLQPLDVLLQFVHISRQRLFLLLQGKKHGQLPKLRLSQQYGRRVLVRRPQLSPQAFEDQVAIRFHIGRRRFCENMILPEVPFQSDQFFFIGHVTVDTADDCLVFRISVKAAEVDPVNVHDRHVVPPLRFIVDRNDFLAVVPPVILGIIVRGLDLKDG